MGKIVVYLQARDENELRAAGEDPAQWVRDLVRRTLDERRGGDVIRSVARPMQPGRVVEPLPPPPDVPPARKGVEFKPDFKKGAR